MKNEIKKTLLEITSEDRKSNYNNDFTRVIKGFDFKYESLFKQKMSIANFLNQKLQFKGLYVFYIDDKALYVGIAKNIRSRIMQHVNGKHHSTSTFAYKVAKKVIEKNGTCFKGTKKDFFSKNLDTIVNIKSTLKDLHIATIEIKDDDELALFEIYCSMKLKTTLNHFETH